MMTITARNARRENYGGARELDHIKYIVLHYTGNERSTPDTAANNAAYFEQATPGVSAHYFVDGARCVQSVPDSCVAWAVGTKGAYKHAACRNANSLSIEMCSYTEDGVPYLVDNAANMALTLTRQLMERYGIPLENVLRHYDVTGKCCPAPMAAQDRLWAAWKYALANGIAFERAVLIRCAGLAPDTVAYLARYTYGVPLLRKLTRAIMGRRAPAGLQTRTCVQRAAEIEDDTMRYLDGYRYKDALYAKLADAMK